ncbi:MAG TPA: SIMPL domain-containing protein [Caulobacteraceae bacterium]|nr:SIMPL domain-containing protein [Caulobacteraceae bacterium]
MKSILIAGLALASLAAAAPAGAQAASGGQTMFDATTLTLSADGQTKIVPDRATITLGVQVTDPTAQAAIRDNAEQMAHVMTALRTAGVPDKDVQTSNISLAAQYTYVQNEPPKATGYEASNEVTITVEDLAKLGPIIDAVAASGANQVNGVSFGLRDPTAAENAARLDAVRALQARADLYAQATGYHVARLVNLSEGEAPSAPIRPMMFAARAAQATPTPVSPGELTVDVIVNATFELAR